MREAVEYFFAIDGATDDLPGAKRGFGASPRNCFWLRLRPMPTRVPEICAPLRVWRRSMPQILRS